MAHINAPLPRALCVSAAQRRLQPAACAGLETFASAASSLCCFLNPLILSNLGCLGPLSPQQTARKGAAAAADAAAAAAAPAAFLSFFSRNTSSLWLPHPHCCSSIELRGGQAPLGPTYEHQLPVPNTTWKPIVPRRGARHHREPAGDPGLLAATGRFDRCCGGLYTAGILNRAVPKSLCPLWQYPRAPRILSGAAAAFSRTGREGALPVKWWERRLVCLGIDCLGAGLSTPSRGTPVVSLQIPTYILLWFSGTLSLLCEGP